MLKKILSFFNKQENDEIEEPAIDPSLGYARLSEFGQLLLAGKYEAFEEAYETLSWDAKTLLNDGIGLNKSYAAAIKSWVEKRPTSYIANLFAGVCKTNLAWLARSSANASEVGQSQAERFIRLLEDAYNYLSEADKLNPEDAEICARTIRVGMGLGIELEVMDGYFNAAIDLIPHHVSTHLMMINYLNPKWHGSVEAMHAFAQERFENGGSSLLAVLPLFAITEEWLYYNMTDEHEKRKAFFRNAELKKYITDLYESFQEEEDGQLLIPYVYNYFAFLFYQFGELEKARVIIKKIAGKMTVYPWAYVEIDSVKKLEAL
jgi:hypothetical protein